MSVPENLSINAGPCTPDPAIARAPARAVSLSWTLAGFATGETLYWEDTPCHRVYSIRSGIVKLIAHLPNGRIRFLGLHGTGAVLGLVTPPSTEETYPHTAVAVTDVEAEWAPAAQLRRLRRHGAREYLDLVERHCEELNHAKRWISEFSVDTTACRIARVIKYLAELQHAPAPNHVELLTCQEMAEVIGVSTESASRVLARFKRLGILTEPGARASSRSYRFDPATLEGIASP